MRRDPTVHLAEIGDVLSINFGICGELMSMRVAALTLNRLWREWSHG